MEKDITGAELIDEYIARFPQEIQTFLKNLRMFRKKAAPEATEKISYQMQTFVLNGNLFHFAAFKEELSRYTGVKASVRFPLDKPLPLEVIERIVRYRVSENPKKLQNPEG